MTKKQLESKISKYLRKANRYKSTQLKLERINELIGILQTASVHGSNGSELSPDLGRTEEKRDETLALYTELCHIHKIKFQMDALFSTVKKDIGMLSHDPVQVGQDLFSNLIQRLQIVLEIDPSHPEAQTLLNTLTDEYPQYAGIPNSFETYLNILPYQQPTLCIEIGCKRTDIENIPTLKSVYASHQIASPRRDHPHQEPVSEVCRLRFSLDQLSIFEMFHEALRTRQAYTITVNGQSVDENFFSEWFQCYKRFLKTTNSQYCYGASPFTFNFFGCHKLYMKDVAKQLEKCWFQYGSLDQNSSLFLVDKDQIARQIRSHLSHCGFCPALTQEKLLVGMALIPAYINPEWDNRWKYFYANAKRLGVVPSGNDIVIFTLGSDALHGESAPSTPSDPSAALRTDSLRTETLIEVGATPYLDKVIRYLQSHNLSELSETTYQGLSHCVNCGSVYKPHTMICSKCKMSFWKYALNDLKKVLAKLRYTKPIVISPVRQKSSHSDSGEFPNESALHQQNVSFTQLWSDPDVRDILLKEQDMHKEQSGTRDEHQALTGEDHFFSESRSSAPKTLSSNRFDLHEKLRSLVSKKYRERKAIEQAFSGAKPASSSSSAKMREDEPSGSPSEKHRNQIKSRQSKSAAEENETASIRSKNEELLDAVKKLRPRQRSELSKRGVVRVIYHATIDKETCPLCRYLDEMVLDPDDPAIDIFSPPLYPGCTCRREYVLKTEKPKNWPKVTFRFPPKELLIYLKE